MFTSMHVLPYLIKRNEFKVLTYFSDILTHISNCGFQAVEYPHRRFQILLRSTMGPIDVYLVRFEAYLAIVSF